MTVMKLENVGFAYGKTSKKVIENINYDFEKGKVYAIVGKSGAGKTTLLSLLSGLASPTEGKVLYQERDIKDIDRYEYRSKYVGVIFQNYNLLTGLTALENVILSMDISGVKRHNNKHFAMELLSAVGLNEDEANRRILNLSGGQQQRVAIARALSYDSDVILADEPTGNLDVETQGEIINLLKQLADKGKCIVVVTHSPYVAQRSDVIYELSQLS